MTTRADRWNTLVDDLFELDKAHPFLGQTIDPEPRRAKGGSGSGDFGHAGRPGEIGGSGEGGDATSADDHLAHAAAIAAGIDAKTWLHGSGHALASLADLRDPVFLTDNAKAADWYSQERGSDTPTVYPFTVDVKAPFEIRGYADAARLRDILTHAGIHVELTNDPTHGWTWDVPAVADHGPYDGTNPFDVAYLPKARAAIQNAGYDSLHGSDVFDNGSHTTLVVLDRSRLHGKFGAKGAKYSDAEPRDDHGRWSDGGGDEYLSSPADALHEIADGQTTDIARENVRALLEKSATRTDHPNLALLNVEGMKIFGGGNLGIPRADMPQIPNDHREQFLEQLDHDGVKVKHQNVDPLSLKPSQDEISATKVGQQVAAHEAGKTLKPIFVSKDNYVLDGHHRWAMMAALAIESPHIKMPVTRLMVNHEKALDLMLDYTKAHGIANKPTGKDARPWHKDGPADEPRDDHGQWTNGGGDSVSHDVREILAKAPIANAELASKLKGIADQLGGEFLPDPKDPSVVTGHGTRVQLGPIKSEARFTEKARQEYAGDAKAIQDVVRGQIAVDRADEVPAVVAALKANFHIVREENRFEQPTEAGYRDYKVNVRLTNGMIGEVQVQVKPMLAAKNGEGHVMYEQMRTLMAQHASAATLHQLLKDSGTLYAGAWASAGGTP